MDTVGTKPSKIPANEKTSVQKNFLGKVVGKIFLQPETPIDFYFETQTLFMLVLCVRELI